MAAMLAGAPVGVLVEGTMVAPPQTRAEVVARRLRGSGRTTPRIGWPT